MPRTRRMGLLQNIEHARNSKVLVYITGDRLGLESRIANDVFPFAMNHLTQMGKQKKIDLFLYSTGGITMGGYGLVNLLREFCDSLGVIIPFKAYSTATLIALGANEIIMTKMGQLSPIDPSLTSPLGPQIQIPSQPGAAQPVPVNVEDVISYLDIARRELKIEDQDLLARVFDRLSATVNPLVLGSVNRVRDQTAFLAKTLLGYHLNDSDRTKEIIEILTRGRFSHDYLIGRKEAKEILGLNIIENESLEKLAVDLYEEYNAMLQLSNPYNAEAALGGEENSKVVDFIQAIVESTNTTHVFRTKKLIQRVGLNPPQVAVPTTTILERVLEQRWIKDDAI